MRVPLHKKTWLQVLVLVGIMIAIAIISAAIIDKGENIFYATMAIIGMMIIVSIIGFGCYVIVDFFQKRSIAAANRKEALLSGSFEEEIDDDATVITIMGDGDIDHDAVYYTDTEEDYEGSDDNVCQSCFEHEMTITLLKCNHKICSICTSNMNGDCPCCKIPIISGALII